ncbi:hypothetical protein AVEN_197017-1 [Araneus ventricosus]|uniref:Uncharacterized protein n=1 Tax=Araneus ventricosus TaxID=182803 RepID=A0A4Y2ED47_ARAVE|nr:hypothetical protein AVEN_197017-1 [Araneus ventricosus]
MSFMFLTDNFVFMEDNRVLLIPWIVSVSMTTILDVILSLYLVTDSEEMDPFFAILVVTDFLICALNVS